MEVLKNFEEIDDKYIKCRTKIKFAFQQFYKEIHLLIGYVNNNYEACVKILKKQKKFLKSVKMNIKPSINLKKIYAKTFVSMNVERLFFLQQEIENSYCGIFYKNEEMKVGEEELEKISQNRLISQSESFFFGIFFGCSFILLVIIVFISIYAEINLSDDMKRVFPLFRGVSLWISYIWLIGFV